MEVGIGSEPFLGGYVHNLKYLFRILKRKLKDTGSLWIQMGDYHDEYGSLRCTPERLMIEMRDELNWKLRSKMIWHRLDVNHVDEPNRFSRDWEYLLFFTKSRSGYTFNTEFLASYSSIFSVRYQRDPTNKFSSGFPEAIIQLVLQWCTNTDDVILDPFMGAGTTGKVALKMDRNFVGIDINPAKSAMAYEQLRQYGNERGSATSGGS